MQAGLPLRRPPRPWGHRRSSPVARRRAGFALRGSSSPRPARACAWACRAEPDQDPDRILIRFRTTASPRRGGGRNGTAAASAGPLPGGSCRAGRVSRPAGRSWRGPAVPGGRPDRRATWRRGFAFEAASDDTSRARARPPLCPCARSARPPAHAGLMRAPCHAIPRSRLVARPGSQAITPWATQTCNGGLGAGPRASYAGDPKAV